MVNPSTKLSECRNIVQRLCLVPEIPVVFAPLPLMLARYTGMSGRMQGDKNDARP
jgi:hypothetical protein